MELSDLQPRWTAVGLTELELERQHVYIPPLPHYQYTTGKLFFYMAFV